MIYNGMSLLATVGMGYMIWILIAPASMWPKWWRVLTDPANWARLTACLPRSTLLQRRSN